MKTNGGTIKHLIGNPLFAIETNLISLEKRIIATPEAKKIIESMQMSVEKIKAVLEDLED